jgi:DNA polymerase III epsilon subunit-like protein
MGLNAAGPPTKGNRIVEIAALEHNSGASMSLLVNIAPMLMPEAAQNVHGISTAMVHDPAVPDFR